MLFLWWPGPDVHDDYNLATWVFVRICPRTRRVGHVAGVKPKVTGWVAALTA